MTRVLCALILQCIIYCTMHAHVSADDGCTPPHWFKCTTSAGCISMSFKCDGEADCKDGSDEKNCHVFNSTQPPPLTCAADQFTCKDNTCIPKEKFCDYQPDCFDQSDEYGGCVKDKECKEFRCRDGYCVHNSWICDGRNDCADGTDEFNCGNETIPIGECNQDRDAYLCGNRRCIPLYKVCNGMDDCGDGSDENLDKCRQADRQCAIENKCEHLCRRTPNGPVCACRSGYILFNGEKCRDNNECNIYGICDQRCINNGGSYICACETGYDLQADRKTCKAQYGEAVMVFTTDTEIRAFYLTSNVYYSVRHDVSRVVALSANAEHVYWVTQKEGEESIRKALIDSPNSTEEVLVQGGLHSVQDLAVDSVTGNVYFVATNREGRHIGVCDEHGKYCATIKNNIVKDPQFIALLPQRGKMYWTEWGTSPMIATSSMDGGGATLFVSTKLGTPNKLVIDEPSDRLYWVDAKLKVIESIRLDGRDRRLVLHSIAKNPGSLAVFENRLYWTDLESNSIQSCEKYTGKDWKIMKELQHPVQDLYIYHSVLTPKLTNPCRPGRCDELCLLDGDHLKASCRNSQKNNSKDKLVIVTNNEYGAYITAEYDPEFPGKPVIEPLPSKYIIGLSNFDSSIDEYSYLPDDVYGGNYKLFTPKDSSLGGLQMDIMTLNLYGFDKTKQFMKIVNFRRGKRASVNVSEEIRDFVLVPKRGELVALTGSYGRNRLIKISMGLAGPHTELVTSQKSHYLVGPKISLSYDPTTDSVAWADQGTGNVEVVSPGGNLWTMRTDLVAPVSLAISTEYIFWTEFNSKYLWRAHKHSAGHEGQLKKYKMDSISPIGPIRMFAKYLEREESHYCRLDRPCANICLNSGPESHVCACPELMIVKPDGSECVQRPCLEYLCRDTTTCIRKDQRCDGRKDCPSGDDEVGCESGLKPCPHGSFVCESGECVNASDRCNSRFDCRDRSDEKNCGRTDCSEHEFRCHDDSCIEKHRWCNGVADCPDNSDELGCVSKTCDLNQFTCDNGRCINHSLSCNGVNNCGDNTDENACSTTKPSLPVFSCPGNRYKCDGFDKCIPRDARCNKVRDCPKGDDERHCPAVCGEAQWHCDDYRCVDRQFVCDGLVDCMDKSDEHDCAEVEVFAIVENDITKISLHFNVASVFYEVQSPVTHLAVDGKNSMIYWSNENEHTIGRINTKTKNVQVIRRNILKPLWIAVDWITGNLYYFDGSECGIKVCDFDKERCAMIVSIPSPNSVYSIVVDPIHGWLFWSQKIHLQCYMLPSNEELAGELWRADLTGSNAIVIARNVSFSSKLALDYVQSRLYWSDVHKKVIESSNLNGGDRRVFSHVAPYGAADLKVSGDWLYWSYRENGELTKCSIENPRLCIMTTVGSLYIQNYFAILRTSQEPVVPNKCLNHQCAYLCVPKGDEFKCISENSTQVHTNVQTLPKQNPIFVALAITVVLLIITISGYYYYQKIKFSPSKQQDLCIRFQNPSYDRRNEIVTTMEHSNVRHIIPGEHEYMNPIISISAKVSEQEDNPKEPIRSMDINEWGNKVDVNQKLPLIKT